MLIRLLAVVALAYALSNLLPMPSPGQGQAYQQITAPAMQTPQIRTVTSRAAPQRHRLERTPDGVCFDPRSQSFKPLEVDCD